MKTVLFDDILPSPEATGRFAAKIGAILQPGDTILLDGPIGAGKTHFARSLIQSLQDHPEDVPSPTFTLVQTYATSAGEVWHADLYRLSGPNDVFETGLADALSFVICLIEWPDRLGLDLPQNALHAEFLPAIGQDARRVRITANTTSNWKERLETCFA